jgi:prevent-host-death family protein
MEKVVSAAEANRNFSQLLRAVRDGEIYIVTAHGRPVAKIMPVDAGESIPRKARSALLKRLRSQRVVNIGPWRRDELYEESE